MPLSRASSGPTARAASVVLGHCAGRDGPHRQADSHRSPPPPHTSLFCASLPTGLSTCSLLSRPHHIRAVDGSLHLTARPTAGGGGGGRAGRGRAVLGDGAQCAEARLRATIACGGLSRLVSVRSAIGTGWLYTGPGGRRYRREHGVWEVEPRGRPPMPSLRGSRNLAGVGAAQHDIDIELWL